MVSDFGIALALGAGGGDRLTETGLSLGTPYYMSPEQATGDQPVGSSTDTYALGSVLYEMLVGEPPYPGTTTQAVLGKIIAGKPVSAREHRSAVPANVDAAIRCAIEKLPADRFGSVQEFAKALEDPGFRHGEEVTAGMVAVAGPWKRFSIALAALAVLASAVAGWALLRPEPPQPVTRQILSTEGWLGLQAPLGRIAALAPDGSSMVLPIGSGRADRQLALKMRGSIEITPIPGTEQAREVVYSPDAQWIAYQVGADVLKRPLVGGAPVTLAEDANPSGVSALAWLDDGSILYEAEDESLDVVRWIARISEDGEPLGIVFGPEEQVAPAWARGLPGARGALVIGCPGVGACFATNANLYVVDLDDLSWEIALEQVMRAWYAPTGHIVYVRADGAVFAQPFDAADLELTGSVIPLFDGVRVPGTYADMLLGADGTPLYVEGEGGAVGRSVTPVWVERDGTAREIDPGWSVPGNPDFSSLTVSPNEDRLAISFFGPSERTIDLWVKQLPMGPLSRLTFEGTLNHRATWSPNGESLRFLSNRAGNLDLWTKRADGSGTAELVLDQEAPIWGARYSSDGTWLVFREGANQAADIYGVRLPMDSAVVPLEVTEFQENSISLSPDGRWLAYVSNRTGSNEVFVRPFPDAGASLQQVSANGGTEPVWAHSGRELFYVNGANELVAVQVSTNPGFAPGQQEVLFSAAGYMRGTTHRMYDVSPDDRRFVMLRTGGNEGAASGEVILVTNWFEELRQRMGN